jgi:hypothetical protein
MRIIRWSRGREKYSSRFKWPEDLSIDNLLQRQKGRRSTKGSSAAETKAGRLRIDRSRDFFQKAPAQIRRYDMDTESLQLHLKLRPIRARKTETRKEPASDVKEGLETCALLSNKSGYYTSEHN